MQRQGLCAWSKARGGLAACLHTASDTIDEGLPATQSSRVAVALPGQDAAAAKRKAFVDRASTPAVRPYPMAVLRHRHLGIGDEGRRASCLLSTWRYKADVCACRVPEATSGGVLRRRIFFRVQLEAAPCHVARWRRTVRLGIDFSISVGSWPLTLARLLGRDPDAKLAVKTLQPLRPRLGESVCVFMLPSYNPAFSILVLRDSILCMKLSGTEEVST